MKRPEVYKFFACTQLKSSDIISMPETNLNLADTEQLLIKGCIEGNRAFQTRLYELFAPKMMGVCLRYAKNRMEAEEILHEGFLRVFTYINKFKGTGSFEGWIRKIMVNCALLRYKNKKQLQPVTGLDAAGYDAISETDIVSNLDAKELLSLIQSLPAGYRIIFNLYVFEGYKHREIAEVLGISEGTSKSNLSDARAFLQKALGSKKKLVYFNSEA
jgi:RNA polymerase sigma factor (sigma-70 family)